MGTNSSVIARNTIFLYIRSFIVLIITLYTSRVILRVLGVEDYGIYNVVGGVISMIGFLNQTMVATYQRYYNYEMGKNDYMQVLRYFRSAIVVQFLVSGIIVLVAETLGLWFVNSQLTIPSNRLFAANCIYQVSIVSFVLMMLQSPFGALIIAHEKMNYFALISILDAVLKLIIVFLLKAFNVDRLILYSFLLLGVSVVNIVLYYVVCKFKFDIGKLHLSWDKRTIKELLGFGGWGMFGGLANTLRSQGINVLLNIYFGPVVNAARGVAYQVLNAINQFVVNFQTAFRPQLTKLYAKGDFESMYKLYYSASKLSYYLMLFLTLPIIIESSAILHVWLGDNVPDHTVSFLRLVLLTSWVSAFANPTSCIAYATGKINKFISVVGGLNLLILPVAWIVLKLGGSPESTMIVSLVITIIAQVVRILIVKTMIPFSLKEYVYKVVFPSFLVLILALFVPLIISLFMGSGWQRLLIICVVSTFFTGFVVWFVGTNKHEKQIVIDKFEMIVHRNSKKK